MGPPLWRGGKAVDGESFALFIRLQWGRPCEGAESLPLYACTVGNSRFNGAAPVKGRKGDNLSDVYVSVWASMGPPL